jgi:hypothetical protein
MEDQLHITQGSRKSLAPAYITKHFSFIKSDIRMKFTPRIPVTSSYMIGDYVSAVK